MKYKVCFICINLFPEGGTAARVLGFAKALAKHGDYVWVADCQTHAGLRAENILELSRYGIRLHSLTVEHRTLSQYSRLLHRLLVLIKCLTWAAGLIDAGDFDVIYCAADTNILGVALKRIARKHVVADVQVASHLEVQDNLMRHVFKLLEKYVCVTLETILVPTPELKRLYASWGIPSWKMHVIRNALEISDFKLTRSREDVRRELGIGNDEIVAAFLGVLQTGYNIDSLLRLHEISRLIAAVTDKVRFLIIGGYDQKPVRDDNFIYTGFVQDLRNYLGAADFAILPIFSNSLGIRSRCVQYFASGLPVVTTPAGITGMQFAEEAGVAIVRRSVEDIALASLELARSQYRLRKMRDNCRRVMNQFDPGLIARQLHSAFIFTE